MGANQSADPADGVVTVREASTARSPQTPQHASSALVDPDLAALRRLAPVAPLLKPPTLRSLLFSRPSDPSLPSLSVRNASALCHEYAALARRVTPLCEAQRNVVQHMASVEALCARALSLLALRSTDVSTSANALRDVQPLRASLQESRVALQQCMARADKLEEILQAASAKEGFL